MLAYSIIMFAITVLFFGLSAAVYRGNINLIHDYHRANVKETEKTEYGKSFSKGLFAIAVSTACSGIAALFGKSILSISVLLLGIIIAFLIIARVQKKFNGGFF